MKTLVTLVMLAFNFLALLPVDAQQYPLCDQNRRRTPLWTQGWGVVRVNTLATSCPATGSTGVIYIGSRLEMTAQLVHRYTDIAGEVLCYDPLALVEYASPGELPLATAISGRIPIANLHQIFPDPIYYLQFPATGLTSVCRQAPTATCVNTCCAEGEVEFCPAGQGGTCGICDEPPCPLSYGGLDGYRAALRPMPRGFTGAMGVLYAAGVEFFLLQDQGRIHFVADPHTGLGIVALEPSPAEKLRAVEEGREVPSSLNEMVTLVAEALGAGFPACQPKLLSWKPSVMAGLPGSETQQVVECGSRSAHWVTSAMNSHLPNGTYLSVYVGEHPATWDDLISIWGDKLQAPVSP